MDLQLLHLIKFQLTSSLIMLKINFHLNKIVKHIYCSGFSTTIWINLLNKNIYLLILIRGGYNFDGHFYPVYNLDKRRDFGTVFTCFRM